MQIERHVMADGGEEIRRSIIEATTAKSLQAQLLEGYQQAMKQPTLREIRQVQFDPEHDPCPCGSKRLAKNCCAKAIVRRLIAQRKAAEAAKGGNDG